VRQEESLQLLKLEQDESRKHVDGKEVSVGKTATKFLSLAQFFSPLIGREQADNLKEAG
jgi:hypothetical protein